MARKWIRDQDAAACQNTKLSYSQILFYLVCFLLGNSPASEFYMPTFRNTLSVPSSMKMEQIECCETSTYAIETPGNYPKENIQYSEHSESLKSRIVFYLFNIIWSLA